MIQSIKSLCSVVIITIGISLISFSCNYEESDALSGKGENIFRAAVEDNYALAVFSGAVETRAVISINRDVVSAKELNQNATIDFELNVDSLDHFNEVNGTEFVMLEPSAYTFVDITGNALRFAAGEFIKDLQIELDPSKLDLSQSYALPIVLKNPQSGYKVSAGSGYAIVQIIVKNQYDAKYHETGTLVREGNPVDGLDTYIDLSTAGAATVNAIAGFSIFGNPGLTYLITVNSDNSVTIDADPSAAVEIYPIAANGAAGSDGKENSYDPATKTFYLNYEYVNGSGLKRTFHTKLIRVD